MNSNARLAAIVVVFLALACGVWYAFKPAAHGTEAPTNHSIDNRAQVPKTPNFAPAASGEEPRFAPPRVPTIASSRRLVAKPSTPVESGHGSFAGVTTNEKDTGVIEGVQVTLTRFDDKAGETSMDTAHRFKATSDHAGKVAIDGLPWGRYVESSVKGNLGHLAEFRLTADRPHYDLRIRMRPIGTIAGVVRDPAGHPVAGATVLPHQRESNHQFRQARALTLCAMTDEHGAFEVKGLQAGRWKLCVQAKGFATFISNFINVGATDVVLTLTPGGSVSGKVFDSATKRPVPGVGVVLSSNVGERGRVKAKADETGKFHVDHVRAAEYTVGLDDDSLITVGKTKVTVTEGQESQVDVAVTRGGVITGRVYDRESGQGIAGAKMTAYPDGGGDAPARSGVKTDAAGVYRITGLAGVRYAVIRGGTPGYAPGRSWRERKLVEVKTGQETSGVDFEVTKGAVVTGKVVAKDGRPVAWATVQGAERSTDNNSSAQSKGDGSFELVGLEPTDQLWLRARKDEFASPPQGPMTLPAEGLHGVVITVEPAGSIEGAVVDGAGKPVEKAGVVARPANGQNSFGSPIEQTNAQGQFTVNTLPPGKYRLSVGRGWNVNYSDSDPQVELGPGQRLTGVKLVLNDQAGLTISGTVTNTSGDPIAGASVNASGQNGWGNTQTDSKGAYQLVGLRDASYQVTVYHNKYTQQSLTNVAAGTSGVDFVLQGRATIQGRVLDSVTDKPITDFEVGQIKGRINRLESGTNVSFVQVHSDTGEYQLTDVEAGSATVIARAKGYAMAFMPVPTIVGGQTVSGIDIKLVGGLSIAGTVTGTDGKPIAGVGIYVNELPQPYLRDRSNIVRTASNGTFKIDDLAATDHAIVAFLGGYAPVSVPITPGSGQPVNIVLSQSGIVQGIVTVGAQPAVGQWVSVYYPNVPGGGNRNSIQTGADGSFKLNGLTPGEATLGVSLRSQSGNPPYRLRQVQVVIADGQTTTVNVDFPTADAALEGTVTRNGSPQSGLVMVTVTSASGDKERLNAPLDGQGHFRFDNLPAGVATVTAQLSDPSVGQGLVSRTVNVTLVSGSVATANVEFAGSANITGTITGMAASAVAQVILLHGAIQIPRISEEAFRQLQPSVAGSAVAGADGTYKFDGVEAGTYTLLAVSLQGGAQSPQNVLATLRSGSAVITVADREQPTVNIAVH